jgi:dTDP-4-amino-4,6-dideoxygalactose transaminase
MTDPIYVTRPSLPPLDEYAAELERAWQSGILTHNGPMVQQLERELCAYLGVESLVTVTSGTIALQLAIRALGLEGEIIAPPFTWIATDSAIRWERCKPVFADVDAQTFNLDPAQIERRITPRTCAIMGVHVFGNPCDVEAIQTIADRHGLKVIYDAAHAMCVRRAGHSVLDDGDISATSFHATKIFQTGEGGGCVTRDPELAERIRQLRFFGFDESKEVVGLGINGKMTEIHAALGLVNLRYIDRVLANRRSKYELYQRELAECPFVSFQHFDPDAYNYSYLPVLFETEELLLRKVEQLEREQIFARRYFHPSLSQIAVLGCDEAYPVAERISQTILCLPLYDVLEDADIERISSIVRS